MRGFDMDIKKIKKGNKYYIVKNTERGPVKIEYTIKEVAVAYVFAINENGGVEKLYSGDIQSFLSKETADELYENIKDKQALKDNGESRLQGSYNWKHCWKCGQSLDPKGKRCKMCNWVICPNCRSCGCGTTFR